MQEVEKLKILQNEREALKQRLKERVKEHEKKAEDHTRRSARSVAVASWSMTMSGQNWSARVAGWSLMKISLTADRNGVRSIMISG